MGTKSEQGHIRLPKNAKRPISKNILHVHSGRILTTGHRVGDVEFLGTNSYVLSKTQQKIVKNY